ncbi:hypothetical protein [Rhodoferax sp.]|uniref:hypothetical protein n=1 Tax=Rhodoferax sp. TaxID=50421 RepID=UPI00261362FC|nr:hypothetical protein [Rhodoferax sp.]MDD2919730.1 hypothetical protein [Rhodoferax sp.]
MTYPFTPDNWTDPISQSIYAGIVLLVLQTLLLGAWKLLKWIRREQPASKLITALGWAGLVMPPILVFALALVRRDVGIVLAATILVSAIPLALVAAREYIRQKQVVEALTSKLTRFSAIGIEDVVVNPDIEAYRSFLVRAHSAFAFQGVGAEKLTRDFEAFQSMVSRCGTPANPVRLLLISPEAHWLKHGAVRRGLGRSSFSDREIQSLQRIARVKKEFSGQILVRFYSSRPVFRLMFANQALCWLGHYTESAAIPGQNEYAEQSNSSLALGKPKAKAPDQQLYGALEIFFEEQWESAKGEEWDFDRFLN